MGVEQHLDVHVKGHLGGGGAFCTVPIVNLLDMLANACQLFIAHWFGHALPSTRLLTPK
jgi:hypothetical protein